jgi:hypothetical protein
MTLGADGVDGRRRLAWLDWRRHRGPEAKEAALVDSGRRHGGSVLKMATWPGCGGSPALAAPAGDAPGLSAEVASGAFGPGRIRWCGVVRCVAAVAGMEAAWKETAGKWASHEEMVTPIGGPDATADFPNK